jgi:4-hydroxybutyryl-CoA dehydratase/vinylacetyl-CoA-Delta-isomerase
MLMSSQDYRDSLRRYRPRVYVDGRTVESVADEPALAPGVNAIGVSYDYALRESSQSLMRASTQDFDAPVNRMNAIPASPDLLTARGRAVALPGDVRATSAATRSPRCAGGGAN